MKTALGIAVLIAICCCAAASTNAQAHGATQPAHERTADGAQQFAALGDFKLRSGAVIHDFRSGYRTFGQLNAAKSNAILWPTWLGGKTQDLVQFIGPDKVVDGTKYFVVLVDAIGDGVSTSPSNSKTQARLGFPEFTIRDMVESEHRFAAEMSAPDALARGDGNFDGRNADVRVGGGLSGFHGCGGADDGFTAVNFCDKLLWTAQIDALEMDPEWKEETGPSR